jgi:2-polyprenyl-3-methyl-5-hydroxy-6-metoxy-1,4-benzoquinol methylase
MMKSYWNGRYAAGRIWGDAPCPSAFMANEHFKRGNVNDVLVPGCGYGRNSFFFAKQGFRVTAFDVSDVAIELARGQARDRSTDLEYAVGDIFDETFMAGKQFDGVYLSNVLHLFLVDQREQILRHITSFLKPGGIFAFSCISVFDTNNYGIGVEIEPNTFEKHEGKPLHFFDENEIQTILEADYRILEQKLHVQTEADPSGETEDLQLWFVAAQKL